MTYRDGDWFVYCDICGQRTYASESTKLSMRTGRGGLIACKHDVDATDYGIIPFAPRRERNVSFLRINHTNTESSSPIVDPESMTYQYYLAASQDGAILMASQDDALLYIGEPI